MEDNKIILVCGYGRGSSKGVSIKYITDMIRLAREEEERLATERLLELANDVSQIQTQDVLLRELDSFVEFNNSMQKNKTKNWDKKYFYD